MGRVSARLHRRFSLLPIQGWLEHVHLWHSIAQQAPALDSCRALAPPLLPPLPRPDGTSTWLPSLLAARVLLQAATSWTTSGTL